MDALKKILMFHDPDLGVYMESIGLAPNLFAIPWFLTAFSHVFPANKVLLIWDSFIAGPPKLIVFFALSVLFYFRDSIMDQDFNSVGCFIALLSELTKGDANLLGH